MSANNGGSPPPPQVRPQPVPVAWEVSQRVGVMPMADGTQAHMRALSFHSPTGTFVAFFSEADLVTLADKLREVVTGIEVAQAMPPPWASPGGGG